LFVNIICFILEQEKIRKIRKGNQFAQERPGLPENPLFDGVQG
jgi:hypothetical protein